MLNIYVYKAFHVCNILFSLQKYSIIPWQLHARFVQFKMMVNIFSQIIFDDLWFGFLLCKFVTILNESQFRPPGPLWIMNSIFGFADLIYRPVSSISLHDLPSLCRHQRHVLRPSIIKRTLYKRPQEFRRLIGCYQLFCPLIGGCWKLLSSRDVGKTSQLTFRA